MYDIFHGDVQVSIVEQFKFQISVIACQCHSQTPRQSSLMCILAMYSSTATDRDPRPPAPPPLPSQLPSTSHCRVSPPGKTGRAWPRSDLLAERNSHGSWPRSDLLAELKAANGTDSLRRSAGTGRVAPSTVYYGKPMGTQSQPSASRPTASTQVSLRMPWFDLKWLTCYCKLIWRS